jgi:hypothetical protein
VSERKTTEIKLRVSPEEKTSWQLAAEQREVGLSQFIRDCVDESLRSGAWYEEGEPESIGVPAQPLSPKTIKKLLAAGIELSTWCPLQTSDTRGEDSSVAQTVPTSDGADVVAKPWMFEARSGD